MKNIVKILSVLALALSLVGCQGSKADFVTYAFVGFGGAKCTVKEDAGQVKIPVLLVSDVEKTTSVTYKITGGNAVLGKHYTMPNTSGVLTISTNPEKCDSIVVCPIDSTGVLTMNKTIEFTLEEVAEDGIYMGNTTKCTLTIIDIDGGINLLVGNWSGSDLASSENKSAAMDFSIEIVDEPDEDYPDANVKIPIGAKFTDPMGNTWESRLDIFAKFDDDKSELQIFPCQIFDAGNFGGNIGVLYVSLDLKSTLQGGEEPVAFSVNDGVLTLKDDLWFVLWGADDNGNLEYSGHTCGYIKSNAEIRKLD